MFLPDSRLNDDVAAAGGAGTPAAGCATELVEGGTCGTRPSRPFFWNGGAVDRGRGMRFFTRPGITNFLCLWHGDDDQYFAVL